MSNFNIPELFKRADRFVFEIEVPGLPESANILWRKSRSGSIHKTMSYIAWERRVAIACEAWVNHFASQKNMNTNDVFSGLQWLGRWPYALQITANKGRWRSKKAYQDWEFSLLSPDTSNLAKSAEDAVCKVFKWRDSQCVRQETVKGNGVDSTFIRFEFFPWLDVVL